MPTATQKQTSSNPAIPADRDPRISPPWSFCGDIDHPMFGHLWAERGARGSTVLFWNPERTKHAMTAFRIVAEGEIVSRDSRDWIVTWASEASAA